VFLKTSILGNFTNQIDKIPLFIKKGYWSANFVDRKTNQEIVLPSREDSYERILEEGGQIATEQGDVESIVFTKLLHQKLYSAIMDLEEVEQYLIVQLFFLERTERSLATELRISQRAVNKRRRKILDKLKNILGNL